MNRIENLFQTKQQNILSIYYPAGYPNLQDTVPILHELEQAGVDMVEIGIPFSDPMADGPVIQDASTRALRNGISLRLIFEQLEEVRHEGIRMPILLMGYLNPIMQYGFERFCQSCTKVGVDGVIIPDLPFADYVKEYRPIANRYDLKMIMLITPETSEERIRLIDENTDGFIYMVSSAATTGAQKDFDAQKQAYFHRIQNMSLKNPCLIGFGISNRKTYETASAHSEGCIIGSKFISLLEDAKGNAEIAANNLLNALKE